MSLRTLVANQTLQDIGQYLSQRGWTDADIDTEYNELRVSERGNGNGTDCMVDPAVYKEAKSLRLEVLERWPVVKCSIDTCDEWVDIKVRIP